MCWPSESHKLSHAGKARANVYSDIQPAVERTTEINKKYLGNKSLEETLKSQNFQVPAMT